MGSSNGTAQQRTSTNSGDPRAAGVRALRPCGHCGEPAIADVTLEVGGASLVVRMCDEHLTALLRGARRVRPERR